MRISARVNIELDKPANYIPMGFWSVTSDYYISDVGIPFVKREDGTALGYSVYALNVDKATKGSWIASQWRLLESAEFLYMQEAYIERLQAAVVTAEMIQALSIKTDNLEVLDGAKIGVFTIENGNLVVTHSWFTYMGSNYVHVNQKTTFRSSGILVEASYGGTVDHPQVVSWSATFDSGGVTVGSMELRRDGLYRNGVLII